MVQITSAQSRISWELRTGIDLATQELGNTDLNTGYTFGLEYLHLLGNSTLDFYIHGGRIYNHIEVESSDGDIIAGSQHQLGVG
ncbi:hypothetical protein [Fodinibius sediminis]|uniref:Uncharacterized protein n=1 Tax=Fodinibius sediminis TaxID=1214077 RepID=A0A521F1A3_9BACT|nr:hypothetical protein [Fodinibius sediminis]SMO89933.1 hypothetical protein SAMN06265218_12129 [Fodinibius sediminis]